MKDIRQVTVSLILRLEDFGSGHVLTPDDAEVSAENGFVRPVYKQDGYFVFTGPRPENISILAERYEDITFTPVTEAAGVFRIALVPVPVRTSVYELRILPGGMAFTGFGGLRAGYAPAGDIAAGATEIALQKNDMCDVTSMWHLLLERGGADFEPVFIAGSIGYGKYKLCAPTRKAREARGCRLLPLCRVVGPPSGVLRLPVPTGASALYVMETGGGEIRRSGLEGV